MFDHHCRCVQSIPLADIRAGVPGQPHTFYHVPESPDLLFYFTDGGLWQLVTLEYLVPPG